MSDQEINVGLNYQQALVRMYGGAKVRRTAWKDAPTKHLIHTDDFAGIVMVTADDTNAGTHPSIRSANQHYVVWRENLPDLTAEDWRVVSADTDEHENVEPAPPLPTVEEMTVQPETETVMETPVETISETVDEVKTEAEETPA